VLVRGFPKRKQGPPVLLSSLGEPAGVPALVAASDTEFVLGGRGLTRQGERGGACWSRLAADWSPCLSVKSIWSEKSFSLQRERERERERGGEEERVCVCVCVCVCVYVCVCVCVSVSVSAVCLEQMVSLESLGSLCVSEVVSWGVSIISHASPSRLHYEQKTLNTANLTILQKGLLS